MTTKPPAPGVVKCVIEGTVGSAPFANILYLLMDDTAGIDNGQAVQIATGVQNAYTTAFAAHFANWVTMLQTTAEDLTSLSGGSGVFANSVVGSLGPSEGSANTCVLVTHKISRRYRGGHPRTYLPGPGGIQQATPQTWASTYVSAMQTAWYTFMTAVISATVTGNTISQHVNVSYFSGHALRTTPVIDPISSSVVETIVGTQRRRIGR